MNKYERLFNQIVDRTRGGQITWKQVRKDANSDLIFNPSRSFRQYSADYEGIDESYKLALVEKKTEDPEYDYMYEKYSVELLVIGGDNELLVTLTDSVIDRSKIAELVEMVEQKNVRVSNLFKM
ncbi:MULTISPECIES: hypothetical protein [Stenotrophomonas]|uniref:hypothetical protein n=1 Tax=Stenotrophomonas TaxID=40323 RepID=UPI00142FB408|nr:hypothetical protein [Stenotrophomonas maltophilia]MCM2992580.1 hypothetical protein [Stenotrophomonas maltophilia]